MSKVGPEGLEPVPPAMYDSPPSLKKLKPINNKVSPESGYADDTSPNFDTPELPDNSAPKIQDKEDVKMEKEESKPWGRGLDSQTPLPRADLYGVLPPIDETRPSSNERRKRNMFQAEEMPSKQALHSEMGTTIARSRLHKRKSTYQGAYGRSHATRDKVDETTMIEAERRGLKLNCVVDEDELDELEKLKQIEIIRQMPVNLHVKRQLREKVLNMPCKDSPLGCCATYKYRCNLSHHRRQRRMQMCCLQFDHSITLWASWFKKVEGHFGSGVLTYFTFLKWLFQLNLFIAVMLFLFIILPMIIFNGLDYDETVTGSVNNTDAVQLAITCSELYVVNVSQPWYQYIADFIQGTGFMEQTIVFYGYYAATELDISGLDYNYNMPLAYLVCVIIYFIVSLCVMVHNTAKGFRERVFMNHGDFNQFCNKVFGGWDFNIGDEKNGTLIHKSLHREFSLLLEEERRRKRRTDMDCGQECKVWTARIFIWLLVLLMLGGAGYLIYFVTVQQAELINSEDYAGYDGIVQFLIQYMTSLTITILNVLLPVLFKQMVRLEDYSAGVSVNITLSRTVLLKLASLAVLVSSLYSEVRCSDQDSCRVGTGSCTPLRCWETYVGQEFFKLVLINCFAQIAIIFFVETPRRLIVDKCGCKAAQMLGRQEFDIPKGVLDLIYTQTLLWFGSFFSPIIPVMTAVVMILLFYAKYFTLVYNYKPMTLPYRPSSSDEFFMVTLLVTYCLCTAPLVYVVYVMTPSTGCGPFRIYNNMYEIIPITVETWPDVLQDIVSFFKSAAVIVPIFVVLCLTIYYLSQVLLTYKKMIKILKDQLYMEGKDKQYLLQKLAGDSDTTKTPKKPKSAKKKRNKSAREDPESIVIDSNTKPGNGHYNNQDDHNSPHVPHDFSM